MKISKEDGRDIIGGDHPDFEFIEETIEGKSRWETFYTVITKHIESGKFYSLDFSRGSTEVQDVRPFEYDDPELVEVERVAVTAFEWRAVSNA